MAMPSMDSAWYALGPTPMIDKWENTGNAMATNSGSQRVRIAVDIGGTFTDLQVFNESAGRLHELKTPTTPDDPAVGLVNGISMAAERHGFNLSDVVLLLHGTTIATNAVLERKFPECALITTEGFEDVLEIGRHMRKDVYGLYAEDRVLLVPRTLRFGLRERVNASGRVLVPLDKNQAQKIVRDVARSSVKAVAVCLINAFLNPTHETAIHDLLLGVLPGLDVSVATDISPEIREYERTSTTVLNALLMPIVRSYAERLEARLTETGMEPRVLLIQSNGGMCTPGVAAQQPARLLLSGPCGGAIAAEYLSKTMNLANLIAVDMGGTSFDVSLVCQGEAAMVTEGEIDGCPVRLPMVDIRTIGAGGGSIARVDESGRLRVGPESAGADPGPACYGNGGTLATVSDANLTLGRLLPSEFLGGTLNLDRDAAQRVIKRNVGEPLRMNVEDAAEGIVGIANANMANAMRLSLFEKGFDPADFSLAAFGGAGGLHAVAWAEELGMNRIVFPRAAGTLSAYGMLWTDILHQAAQSRILRAVPENVGPIQDIVYALLSEGRAALDADGIEQDFWNLTLSVDMRYVGQGYELTIPWNGLDVEEDALASAVADFHTAHRSRFLHADLSEPVEIVTLRVAARGQLERPAMTEDLASPSDVKPKRHRVYFDGFWHDVDILHRSHLQPGLPRMGPLLITEEFTTILLLPNWRVEMHPTGNLIADRL